LHFPSDDRKLKTGRDVHGTSDPIAQPVELPEAAVSLGVTSVIDATYGLAVC
jgi:hypothetical protein